MVKLLKFPACKLMRGLPHATYVVRMRLKQLHAQGGAHLHTYQGMVPKILTPVSTGRICLLPALNGRSGPPNQVSTGKEPHKRKCRTDESSHQRGISLCRVSSLSGRGANRLQEVGDIALQRHRLLLQRGRNRKRSLG